MGAAYIASFIGLDVHADLLFEVVSPRLGSAVVMPATNS
jgi:hypothetical protein